MRENFEKWVKETSYSTDWSREGGGVNPDSEYLKPRVRDAWACWQAAAMWRGNADEEAIYSAYLGICVLRTMCRKVNLQLAEQRCADLVREIGQAYPHFAGLSALR